MTKRMFFYCQLFLTIIIFTFNTPTVKADFDSKPTFRILKSASELDYPPFALVRQDGSADGFSVDLLKAVTHAVGIEINFIVGPWHEIKKKLTDGQLDVLPLVSYSQEREKIFDFTASYLRMHGTIFVRKGEKTIRGIADLKGKEILVMRSDAAHEYAIKGNLSDILILTASFEEALQRLSEGQHDAVVIQQVMGHQLVKKLGISNLVDVDIAKDISMKPVGKPLSGFEQKFSFAVPDGDKELVAILNEGLAVVIANGTYDELYNRWFAPILPKLPIPISRILKYSLVIIGPILFLLLIVGIWYLKREVSKKTLNLSQEIKERKHAEVALLHLNETLEQQVAQRTELAEARAKQLRALLSELTLAEERERRRIADILHDGLQQILVAVKMNLENLSARIQPDKQQDIQRILEMVRESIRKSRVLTAELSPPVLKHHGLIPALEWLAKYFQQAHGLSVELQLDPRVAVSREGFKLLLFQCIRELLFNVIKHASVSSVCLSLVVDDSNNVCITVNDKGIGFDPDTIESDNNQETGYGLFSIKERLALIGGCFEVDSAPGKGTTCTLIAPLKEDELTQIEDCITPEESASIPLAAGTGQKICILLVDDHAVMREGLSSLLNTQSDIEIVGEAADGEQAVARARELHPNVILMDVNMPKVNGIEATGIISSELPGTRIIGLSMYDDNENRSAMLAAGAVSYLTKDGTSEALLGAIRDRSGKK